MRKQPETKNARRLRQKLRALIADKNTMPIDKKVYKAKLDQLETGQLTEKLISAELDRIEAEAANRDSMGQAAELTP